MTRQPFWILFALAALTAATAAAAEEGTARRLPSATGIQADLAQLPTLDELSSLWLDVSQLVQMPSLHNFHDMAVCTPDLLGMNYLPGGQLFSGPGPRWTRYNTLPPLQVTIDGKPAPAELCRWFAYQAMRTRRLGNDMAIATSVRLVFEGRGLMYQIAVTNNGREDRNFSMAISMPYDDTTITQRQEPVITYRDVPSGYSMAYAFTEKPDDLEPNDNQLAIRWAPRVRAGGKAEFAFVMACDPDPAQAAAEALRLARASLEIYRQAYLRWAERWRQAFTPGNPHFSGSLPVLLTTDTRLREIYYRSILTLLTLERTDLAGSDRVFITQGERARGRVSFWETSLWPTLFALLEPRAMRGQLDLMLQCDPRRGGTIDMATGRQEGRWRATNDYALFRLARGYLAVTGDAPFLARPVGGRPALERIADLAAGWRGLLARPGDALADYGTAAGLLECVPTYEHRVASLNGASVWMMRELAALRERRGEAAPAAELRAAADRLAQAVLGLYAPGQGVWNAQDGARRRTAVRHAIDYALVGDCLRTDLSDTMKGEMFEFVKKELMTSQWMRALSLEDPAAERSDRPDNGPLGAADAWPALTATAMAELGEWARAIAFLRQIHSVLGEGPFAQAHELYGPRRFELASSVRIAERGGCLRECASGGAYAEAILTTIFGFRPEWGGEVRLFEPAAGRGFEGELRHVRRGKDYYTILSGMQGLRLVKEP